MNKRGATMVEAALVFPLVILTVAALIHMLVFFYQLAETRANMHMALRAESGRISKTVKCEPSAEPVFPIYKKATEVYCLGNKTFMERGLLKKLEKPLSAKKYVDHEADFVRTVDLVMRKDREDEHE